MSYERVRDETRLNLIAIAALYEDNKRSYLAKKMKVSFAALLEFLVYNSKSPSQSRTRIQNFNNRLQEYEQKGLIKKRKAGFMLTNSAWKILGGKNFKQCLEQVIFLLNSKDYGLKRAAFNSERFNRIKKIKDKKEYLDSRSEKMGILGQQKKFTSNAYKCYQDFRESIINLAIISHYIIQARKNKFLNAQHQLKY